MAENKRQNEIIRIQKKQNNFAMIDKGFIDDNRLSFKAKGILTYLLSKPDNWKVIVKDLINHAKDGRDSIYAGLNELKKHGYYSKTPVRNEKGVVTHWDSVIYEDPAENPENKPSYPHPGFPYLENPDTVNPDTEMPERNKNYISNNKKKKIKYNDMDSSQSQSQSRLESTEKIDMTLTIDSDTNTRANERSEEIKRASASMPIRIYQQAEAPIQSNYNVYETLIKDNIEYNQYLLYRPNDIELVNELVSCMLDVICTLGDTVKINGEQKHREMVKSQYLKINHRDIEHILDRYHDQTHEIIHLHSYLKTMLYTCKQENGHFYANAVRADGLVGRGRR